MLDDGATGGALSRSVEGRVTHAQIVRMARSTTNARPASHQGRVDWLRAGRPAGSILATCMLMTLASSITIGAGTSGRPKEFLKSSSTADPDLAAVVAGTNSNSGAAATGLAVVAAADRSLTEPA